MCINRVSKHMQYTQGGCTLLSPGGGSRLSSPGRGNSLSLFIFSQCLTEVEELKPRLTQLTDALREGRALRRLRRNTDGHQKLKDMIILLLEMISSEAQGHQEPQPTVRQHLERATFHEATRRISLQFLGLKGKKRE